MLFYIYHLVEPLILPNTSISLLATSHQLSAISYSLFLWNMFVKRDSSFVAWIGL